jgi:hypothetical protein
VLLTAARSSATSIRSSSLGRAAPPLLCLLEAAEPRSREEGLIVTVRIAARFQLCLSFTQISQPAAWSLMGSSLHTDRRHLPIPYAECRLSRGRAENTHTVGPAIPDVNSEPQRGAFPATPVRAPQMGSCPHCSVGCELSACNHRDRSTRDLARHVNRVGGALSKRSRCGRRRALLVDGYSAE